MTASMAKLRRRSRNCAQWLNRNNREDDVAEVMNGSSDEAS